MNRDQSTGGVPEREEPQVDLGPTKKTHDAASEPIDPGRKSSWPPDGFPPEPWEVALPESRSRFAPEYSADPETAVIVFDELWNAAGDD